MADTGPSLKGCSHMSESSQPLNVLIVGAGIGGLTAALALRRQGHRTTVFEQSRLANEIGAAINVAPNCNGVLRRLGVLLENHGAVDCAGTEMYDGEGVLQERREWGVDFRQKYGFPYHLMHRAHLHKAIKDQAIQEEGEGTPTVLHTASRVTEVDPETATVTLENGQRFCGDLIIGADGIHSKTRARLEGAAGIEPFGSGMSGFRFMVDMKKLAANPLTAQWLDTPGAMLIFSSKGSPNTLVMYPCQSGEIMNCMYAIPSKDCSESRGSGWQNESSKEHMLSTAAGLPKALQAVLETADPGGIRLWELMDMDILPTWVRGSLALLGDAAHPFTPWRGQGGAMAIEDAASLGALLPLGTKSEDIRARLDLYQRCRRDRAHGIQDLSRRTSPLERGENRARGLPGEETRKLMEGMLSHDEWKLSEEALQTSMMVSPPAVAAH